MESAIPTHLKCPRTRTRRIEDDYAPPYPAWVARSSDTLRRVVMFYFGVQYRNASLKPSAEAAVAGLVATFGGDHAPIHHEAAACTDEHGYATVMVTAYWATWWAASEVSGWWETNDRSREDLGYFKEIAMPVVDNFETLFSAPDQLEGVGVAMGERSVADIQEHGYWGSMRDRIPASLDPKGSGSGLRIYQLPSQDRFTERDRVLMGMTSPKS